jgi:hypothetical protein
MDIAIFLIVISFISIIREAYRNIEARQKNEMPFIKFAFPIAPPARTESNSCITFEVLQLVPYDAVNRNKVTIRQLPLFYFFFLLTTCFGPYWPSSGEIYN